MEQSTVKIPTFHSVKWKHDKRFSTGNRSQQCLHQPTKKTILINSFLCLKAASYLQLLPTPLLPYRLQRSQQDVLGSRRKQTQREGTLQDSEISPIFQNWPSISPRLILTKPVPARSHHAQVFVLPKENWCHRQLLWVLLPAQKSWEHMGQEKSKHGWSKQLVCLIIEEKESIAWIPGCFYDFSTYLCFCLNPPEFCTIHLGQILYVLEASRHYQIRKQESGVLKYKPVSA